ncbi:beta strand repeat-containing protein [Neobacillus sp. Marseille-QA0830]
MKGKKMQYILAGSLVLSQLPIQTAQAATINWMPYSVLATNDPEDQSPSSTDIVGDVSSPSVYYFVDNDYVYFRMRVNGDPHGNGKSMFGQYAWTVLFNSDTEDRDWEYMVSINGNGEKVELWRNDTKELNSMNDQAERLLWSGPVSEYASISTAESSFSNNPDYYIDWKMPLSEFTKLTSIGLSTPIQMFYSTSAQSSNYNKDRMNGNPTTLEEAWGPRIRFKNNAPVINSTFESPIVLLEDQSKTDTLSASDLDGDTLTYAISTQAQNGTAAIDSKGFWTYTPTPNFHGDDSFTITVSDGFGGSASVIVGVQVQDVNQPPTVNGQPTVEKSVLTQENAQANGMISAADPDNDSLVYRVTKQASGGTASVANDGSWTYIPRQGFYGLDSFTVTVSDGNNGTATVNVNVKVNKAPAVGNNGSASVSTPVNMAVSDNVGASDANGDALTYSISTKAAHGLASVSADGTWTYTPNQGYAGTDSFIISVSDGNGGVASYTVQVKVNQAPVVGSNVPSSVSTPVDTPVSNKITATDTNGDALTYSVSTQAANGAASVGSDGTWTYTPNQGYVGTDTFIISVSDGNNGVTYFTVHVKVNQAPVVGNNGATSVSTQINTAVSGNVGASDANGDALAYPVSTQAVNGAASVGPDGTWTYTPNQGYVGTDSFVISVSDGDNGVTYFTVHVKVNQAPAVGSNGLTSVSTQINTAVSGNVGASDANGDALAYSVSTQAVNGAASVGPDGTWTYTPNQGYVGTDSFVISVSDGDNGVTYFTVHVKVNQAPAVGSNGLTSVSTQINTAVSGNVGASDANGDALAYSVSTQAVNGAASVGPDGTWTYTPNQGYVGTDSFSISVSDGDNGVTYFTVHVKVNQAPAVGSNGLTSVSTQINTAVSGNVGASDANGDALAYSVSTQAVNGAASVGPDGTWTYTPNQGYVGTDSFSISVSDGDNGVTYFTVHVKVNQAPAVGSNGLTSVSTQINTAVSGNVGASDANGDALAYSVSTQAAHGSASVGTDGTWTYTPSQGYVGTDSFIISVSDGDNGVTSFTVQVKVNQAPVVGNNGSTSVSTQVNTAVSGNVGASDANGDALTYSVTTQAVNGAASVGPDGTWTYTPNQGYVGTDSFSISVSDGDNGVTYFTVHVKVNQAPAVGSNGSTSVSTKINTAVSGNVGASDANGDALAYSVSTQAAHGSASVGTDGTWTYTPSQGYVGTDSFIISVSDGDNGVTSFTVQVKVNQAPVVGNNGSTSVSTQVNTAVSGNVGASDANGDALTYSVTTQAAHGSASVGSDGTWTYTPSQGYVGTDSFILSVSDGDNGVTSFTVQVKVNQAPVFSNNGATSVSTQINTAVSGNVGASDANGDTLTYSVATQAANGTASVGSDGTWTYTPRQGYVGSDSFIISVSDGDNGVTFFTVHVKVNQAPSVGNNVPSSVSTQVNTPVFGSVGANDANGDTLTYTVTTQGAHGFAVVDINGNWTYMPYTNYYGTDSFIITVSDGDGGFTSFTVQVKINKAPVVGDNGLVNIVTKVNTPISGSVQATDDNGDALAYTVSTRTEHGSATVNQNGSWSYIPNQGYIGNDSFIVTVSDNDGGNTFYAVNIKVNQAPVVSNNGLVSVSTPVDTPVSDKIIASDANGDALSYTISTQAAHGSASVNNDGTWTYTPDQGYAGGDSFTMTISDGDGGDTPFTVQIKVNQAPIISNNGDVNVSTQVNTPVSGNVKATDANGDIITYAVSTQAAHGESTVNPDGSWIYTPAQGYTGTDSFSISVSDGDGGTTSLTILIKVNQAPIVANNGSVNASTQAGTAVAGSIQATDANGDSLTYTVATQPGHGTATINPYGTWTYTPDTQYSGDDSFIISVVDHNGGETKVIVNVTVAKASVTSDSNTQTVVQTGTTTLPKTGEGYPVKKIVDYGIAALIASLFSMVFRRRKTGEKQ